MLNLNFFKRILKRSDSRGDREPDVPAWVPPLSPVDSLRSLAERHGVKDLARVKVALDLPNDLAAQTARRNQIPLRAPDGTIGVWTVESLRGLFRGSKKAPTDEQMDDYPREYVTFFANIEWPLIEYCGKHGDPTDEEIMGVYSALRRRPDGASMGALHDFLWRTLGLELGRYVYSEDEYNAVLRRLERSARVFKMGPTSRHYLQYLRRMFYRKDLEVEDEEAEGED